MTTRQASPLPTTLGAPWGRGCSLPRQSQTRPFLSDLLDPPASLTRRRAPATVICSTLSAGTDGLLAGAIWYRRHRRYDSTTMVPGPCSESVPPHGGEAAMRCHRRSAVGTIWSGWGSMPVVFSPGMAGHPCPTLRATSLSLQGEPADIGKG